MVTAAASLSVVYRLVRTARPVLMLLRLQFRSPRKCNPPWAFSAGCNIEMSHTNNNFISSRKLEKFLPEN
jgi:hypothetical protein